MVGFRYWTDVAVAQQGFAVDEIAISGQATDGAEGSSPWTFVPAAGGFHVTTGQEVRSYFNTYLAEFRQYRQTFDASLQHRPV